MSKVPTVSLPSGIVETFDKHDISWTIEAEETHKKYHWKFERWCFFYWMTRYNLIIMNKLKNKVDGKYEKMSLSVINGAVWLKDLLVGTLHSFQQHN